ncbi:putative DNA methylase [Magnetospirillum sp. XM-1]|uniref:DNA cytosine methyltransferase n=1 Tax=Magnetospirillum sp. XM-1 TaxID=1663591 RepID=UPI00073DF71A|nr:DNA cytosine methyltransferase [Magnetospirillum sp. XM-1]CUW37085.1 putative DNA methylase [Magnetospirillum sp. XM-1]
MSVAAKAAVEPGEVWDIAPQTEDVIRAKIFGIRRGTSPRVIDIFSGCGGFSLGFLRAGCEIVAGLDIDPEAAASHAFNFHGVEVPSNRDELLQLAADITKLAPHYLPAHLGRKGTGSNEFADILIGGPPCQAFARIGRAKLRQVAEHPEAFLLDPRSNLYLRYLDYVRELLPVALVMENVPDILNFGGRNVPEEICETLKQIGYIPRYTLLNAASYGVPQFRERFFLVAIHRSLGIEPSFPLPTHHSTIPNGYKYLRATALAKVPDHSEYFVPAPAGQGPLKPFVTSRRALADLPVITEHRTDPALMRRRKMSERIPYSTYVALDDFALTMRDWKGLPKSIASCDGHLVRLTPRDFETFANMKHGGDYPHALEVAEAIFLRRLSKMDSPPRRNSCEYISLRSQFVPPYDQEKFKNKWGKLDPKLPAKTLTAHLSRDTYSHIHWDSRQGRAISVREAARLQSFPDSFRFVGAMNAAYRQIGNAVPPLLGYSVASHLLNLLRAYSFSKP